MKYVFITGVVLLAIVAWAQAKPAAASGKSDDSSKESANSDPAPADMMNAQSEEINSSPAPSSMTSGSSMNNGSDVQVIGDNSDQPLVLIGSFNPLYPFRIPIVYFPGL